MLQLLSTRAPFSFCFFSSSDEPGFADALRVPVSELSADESEPDVWP